VRRHPRGTADEYRGLVDGNRFPRATLAAVTATVVGLVWAGPGTMSENPSEPAPLAAATTGSVAPAPPAARGTAVPALGPGGSPARARAAASGEAGSRSEGAAPAARPAPAEPGRLPDADERDAAERDVADEPVGPETATSPEGFLVVQGTREAGSGPTVHFSVEIEPGTGIDPGEALEVAEGALLDRRSWAREHHLVRVGDPALADVRLLFATPETVDDLCQAVGLDTNGVYSCWTGTFAAINSWRYAFGAKGFDDLDLYRRYVVNHEVGHGLGHRHVGCSAEGATAPIMLQQSASLEGCVANGWPHPAG
jgi:hypothetical protein